MKRKEAGLRKDAKGCMHCATFWKRVELLTLLWVEFWRKNDLRNSV